MKYILLFILIVQFSVSRAQEKGTRFRELTLDEALETARQNPEGPQLILVDCYTQWCAPCKLMVNNIFPREEVGDFMNANFICIKSDIEKEGVGIGKRFGITSYPTFLILDKKGNEVNRIVGGVTDPELFIARIRQAMIPKTETLATPAAAFTIPRDSVVIYGKVIDEVTEMSLLCVRNGQTETFATPMEVDRNGNFNITFQPPYKGIYMLSDGYHSYRLYLAPGTYANVTLNNGELMLNQTNSQPLRLLNMWDYVSANVKKHSELLFGDEYAPEAFFNELNALVGYTKYLTPEYTTTDAEFNRLMSQLAECDIVYYALYYSMSTSGRKIASADLPELYHHLFQDENLNGDALMQLPYGTELISLYTRFAGREKVGMNLEELLPLFTNPLYKGEVVLLQAGTMGGYDEVLQLTRQYAQYLATDNQKARVEQILQRLSPFKGGSKAIPFTCVDAQGRQFSLTDLKGKLVLVDVWATTCNPCKTEFPYLKQLAEQFKNKKIVFVGVSTDRREQEEAWKEYINREELPGIQLFAGDKARSLLRNYQIGGIPRYMLFDKKGNIITVDAPWPSNPALKQLIEKKL